MELLVFGKKEIRIEVDRVDNRGKEVTGGDCCYICSRE
jgi:hypothetical protein